MSKKMELGALVDRTPEVLEANGEPVDDETNGSGRGGLKTAAKSRAKKGRLKSGEKLRGCKHSIRGSVFERLRQTSIKRGKTMSELVDDILGRHLPYFDVIQRDTPPAVDD